MNHKNFDRSENSFRGDYQEKKLIGNRFSHLFKTKGTSVGAAVLLSLLMLLIFLAGCKKDSISNSSTSSTSSSSTTSSTSTSSSSSSSYYYQSGGTVTQTGKTYYSAKSDRSAVEVISSGVYTLSNSKLWSSASTTSTDSSSFYGLNACALAYNSTLTMNNDSITTTGIGGNGVFSYGTANVVLANDTIYCSGSGGHGIYAAGGGTLSATSVLAVTSGSSSSVIATDRGGGTITVSGGSYTASGSNSAAVYSTGSISCSGATLKATGAEAIVVEGSNSATLSNCTTTASYNKWGALIYQSSSGDASGTSGVLTITGGTFTYTGTKGGMFYNTNDAGTIYLTGVTLNNSCDTLVRAILGSWGNSTGTSGGNATLVCSQQTIAGIIYADANSSVTLKLTNSSSYSGRINTGDIAKVASVVLDASSKWTLTGDTYLTSLTDATSSYSNITSNGHKLYLNGTQVL